MCVCNMYYVHCDRLLSLFKDHSRLCDQARRPLQALELPPPAHGTVSSSLAVTFFWFRPSNTALTRYSKSRFLQIPVAPLGEAPYRRWGKLMENLVI